MRMVYPLMAATWRHILRDTPQLLSDLVPDCSIAQPIGSICHFSLALWEAVSSAALPVLPELSEGHHLGLGFPRPACWPAANKRLGPLLTVLYTMLWMHREPSHLLPFLLLEWWWPCGICHSPNAMIWRRLHSAMLSTEYTQILPYWQYSDINSVE